MNSKQVLVMRKFSKLRTGKYISQGAHASMGSLFSIGKVEGNNFVIPMDDPFVKEWITGMFKKIVLYVDNEEELVSVYELAKNENLPCALIKDNGLTEFYGVPTLTAVGIGPANADDIDKITGKLSLF